MNRHLFLALAFILIAIPAKAMQFSSPARWSQCAEQTLAAKSRQAAKEGHNESYYFGASGWGARHLVLEVCGPKPSPGALSADERAVLEDWCQDTENFRELPMAAIGWFQPYGDTSAHWRLAVTECRRIYRSKTPAPTQSSTDPRLAACAHAGEIAIIVTRLRDTGVPLTFVLDRFLPLDTEKNVAQFMYTLFLDIYSKNYWNTLEAQRQAETRCLTTLVQ